MTLSLALSPCRSKPFPPDLCSSNFSGSLLQVHDVVKRSGKPNFLQARIPIQSQLKVGAWEEALGDYWDKQLIELIKFGFPLDFNRACDLGKYTGNHSSAVDCPKDIEAYIEEELQYGALLGPFKDNPIPQGHCSPFMTRSKPNSDRRRVIVDLSWPQGASVNAGIISTVSLPSHSLQLMTLRQNLSVWVGVPYSTRWTSAGRFAMSRWTLETMTCWGYIGRVIASTLAFRSGHVLEVSFFSV